MTKIHKKLQKATVLDGTVEYYEKTKEPLCKRVLFELTGLVGKSKTWTWSVCPGEKINYFYVNQDVTITDVYHSGLLLQHKHDYVVDGDKVCLFVPTTKSSIITIITE